MKFIALITLISILGVTLCVEPTEFIPSRVKEIIQDGLATPLPGNNIRVAYIDRLSSYWGAASVAAAIGLPGYAQSTLYNVINLAFILDYGEADAASVWANPFGFMEQTTCPFGKTVAEVQQNWRDTFHKAGMKIMLSAFGATEFPTSQGIAASEICPKIANFVKDNYLDGIDLDYEDNEAMNKGTAPAWLIECTQLIRNILPSPNYTLTHAPQAPYFIGNKTGRYPNGAYLDVDAKVGNLIDWYNVQFYNQGDTTYDTYDLLFVNASKGEWNGTAVKQIISYGIPANKIVLGKPVTVQDASNTGWVSASDLHTWAAQASSFWSAGLMVWQYPSDKNGSFVNTYING